MAPKLKIKLRNAALALVAGLIAGGGTIAGFAQHAVHPAAHASVRPFDDSQQGFDILRRMLEADSNMPIEGDQTTLLYRNGKPIQSEQHILRDGCRGMRITYSAPPRMAQTVIVDDGATLYQYNGGKKNELNESPSKLAKRLKLYPAVMHAHAEKRLSVSVLDNDNVAGRPCTVIQVERKQDPGPIRTFWVDDATGVQLKVQVQERDGVLRSVTQFTSIAFNVQIPPGAFAQPETRPGVQIVHSTPPAPTPLLPNTAAPAGFAPLKPTWLPTGYQFQNAQVTQSVEGNMIHARYSNGVNTLSIFQTLSPRHRDSQVSYPQTGVATMIVSGHRVIVIANLPNDQLSNVLTSMHP